MLNIVFFGLLPIAFVIHQIYRYLFYPASLMVYKNPYQKPGLLFNLKWTYQLLKDFMYWKPKKRFSPCDFDFLSAQSDLECPQELKTSKTMDEIEFLGVNSTSDAFLHVMLARRKDNKSEATIHFILNEGNTKKEFQMTKLPKILTKTKTNKSQCWSSKNLKIECLEPLRRWKVAFNGFLLEKKSNQVFRVAFTFVWVPYTAVIDHQSSISLNSRSRALSTSTAKDAEIYMESILGQYDTWGTFYGSYSIDNNEYSNMILFGSKIRKTGTMNYHEFNRYLEIKVYSTDGSTLFFKVLSIPNQIPELIYGYVTSWRGAQHSIEDCDFEIIRMDNFESFPSLLSIRFKAGSENFILVVESNCERMNHYWGPREELNIQSGKASTSLTILERNLILKGSGVISLGLRNDEIFEELDDNYLYANEPDLDNIVLTPDILSFEHDLCKSSELVGGKGSSLAMLKQMQENFLVPNGFCLTIAANETFINENPSIKQAIQNLSDACCGKMELKIEQECKRIAQLFDVAEISELLKNELSLQLQKLFGKNFMEIYIAVRSSATNEDGDEISAAGQMDTILGCKGFDEICEGIKKCWASCYGFRAVEYRRQNGQLIKEGMGVVIQEMVNAEKAGVLFTRDPITADPGIISIAANFGIGESVVSAVSEADTIEIKRTYDDILTISKIYIGKKEFKADIKGDMIRVKYEDIDKKCCLSNQEALDLAQISVLIEKYYENSRDIEWAIYKGNIYILQSRPISNIFPETENDLKNELNTALQSDQEFATSGNIKEVFPGASSPLSQTLTNEIFKKASAKFSKSIGNSIIANNLFVRGNIVYQQHRFTNRGENMYASQKKNMTPWEKQLIEAIDIGFNGAVIDDGNLKTEVLKRTCFNSLFETLKVMLKTIKLIYISYGSAITKARNNVENKEVIFDNSDSTEELAKKILYNQDLHSDGLYYHIIFTMGSLIRNASVLIKLNGNQDEIKTETLTQFAQIMSTDSVEDVESADVPAALKKLAEKIIEKTDEENFKYLPKQEGLRFLIDENSPLKNDFEEFLQKHGHRCIKEFDHISKTWRMEPEELISPLQMAIRSKSIRAEKKQTIDESIENLKVCLSNSQKKSLKEDVLNAKKFIGYREQTKSFLIRAIDKYRHAIRFLANRMVLEGRIPDEDLIFFMTVDEIMRLIKTRSPLIIQKANKRKRLYPVVDKLQFPYNFKGIPVPINNKKKTSSNISKVLQGVPVSMGIIEGTARVITRVEDAHEIQPGEILVTVVTDIAWSPYFPTLSGLITEIGGLISHGSVIAREYGIPCVVNVHDATYSIKSGDVIRLNGNNGKIEKLNY